MFDSFMAQVVVVAIVVWFLFMVLFCCLIYLGAYLQRHSAHPMTNFFWKKRW